MNAELKPHIFIGSSKEGKGIADQICEELSDVAECKIWTEQFDFGNSAYEELVKRLALYDYGVLVASSDDQETSRGKRHLTPRDNILFEFGLFVGRFGRQRSFLFVEEGVKLPSDLNGITLPFYRSVPKGRWFWGKQNDPALLEARRLSVIEKCRQIKAHIINRSDIFDYGFLPSTSLAYGYFNNFLVRAVDSLLASKVLMVEGKSTITEFKDVEFTILIPNDLSSDMFYKIKQIRTASKWELVKIDSGSYRPFDFYMEFDGVGRDVVRLSDMPITLNALNDSIRSYIGKGYVGDSDAERLIESREIRVFKGVLDYLVRGNPLTKGRVKTEIIDV